MVNDKIPTIENIEKSMKHFENLIYETDKWWERDNGFKVLASIKNVIECQKRLGDALSLSPDILKSFDKALKSSKISDISDREFQDITGKWTSITWGYIDNGWTKDQKEKILAAIDASRKYIGDVGKKIDSTRDFRRDQDELVKNKKLAQKLDVYDQAKIKTVLETLHESLKKPSILQKVRGATKKLGERVKTMRSKKTSDRQR